MKLLPLILLSLVITTADSQEANIDLYANGLERHISAYYKTPPSEITVVYNFGVTDSFPSVIGDTKINVIDENGLRRIVKKSNKVVLVFTPLNLYQGKLMFSISEYSASLNDKNLKYLKHGVSEFTIDKENESFKIIDEYHSGI